MRLPRLSCGVNLLAECAEAGAEETFKSQMIKTARSTTAARERAGAEPPLAAPNIRICIRWIRISAPRCRRRPRLCVICASPPIVRHFLHELDKVLRFRQTKGFLPQSGSLVADDDDRAMVVFGLDVLPDLVQSQVDILFLAREKIPSGFGMEPLRILFEPRRRIRARIHTDRDEKMSLPTRSSKASWIFSMVRFMSGHTLAQEVKKELMITTLSFSISL